MLQRHYKNFKQNGAFTRKQGGQTVLTKEEEELIVDRLILCGEWGYPLDTYDLRLFVKGYLDRRGKTVEKFKNNMPGKEFAAGFLKRHRDCLRIRMSQNIKRSRAGVTPEKVKSYFDNLRKSIEGIPPTNIVNYDETNLTNDPGRKKVIVKRGCKYPEKVMNFSKSSVSLMIAAAGNGTMLLPYTVYKAKELYHTWIENGPRGARFNRSKSGWFDSFCFEDWLITIALPYLKKLPGEKLLIGDNLSSHLSVESVKLCEEHNVKMVFLPSNSSHITQPLDKTNEKSLERNITEMEVWTRLCRNNHTKGYISSSLEKTYRCLNNRKQFLF